MDFKGLFPKTKPLIACIHLLSLPGSPGYAGSMKTIIKAALDEAKLFNKYAVDGLIVENFRDNPFYPDNLPSETVAAMTAVTREIVKKFKGPVGVNALRNDAHAALSVATAAEAHFIRINIHIGAALTDQGIIEGKAWETMRIRKSLNDNILIFADASVKHSNPLGNRTVIEDVKDLSTRGMADAIIITGTQTGGQADPSEIIKAAENTALPILVGSGITDGNLKKYFKIANGFIVGSFFKKDGKAINALEEGRIFRLTSILKQIRKSQ
jgi:membrane complex biogenesis BtpA family protein